jgi:hypothetical protein
MECVTIRWNCEHLYTPSKLCLNPRLGIYSKSGLEVSKEGGITKDLFEDAKPSGEPKKH